MNRLPKISIVIPTYNSEETLQETFTSISSQHYKNLELIVIDGKSVDGTLEIIEINKHNISIFISEPDLGVYDAMNKGAELSSGEWVYFLGSDDVLLDGSLKKVADFLKSPRSVYYGDVIFKYENIKYTGRISKYRLMLRNFPHQAVFYPRSVFKNYSYNLRYEILADYVLNIQLTGEYRFVYIDFPIAIFNDQEGLSSNNSDINFEKDRVNIYKKELGLIYAVVFLVRFFLVKFFRKIPTITRRTQ